MKPIGLKIWIMLFIPFLFISCEEEIDTQNIEKKQLIYFQRDYRNYAWGYAHNGWFVDSAGNVISYYLPESWTEIDTLGNISDSAQLANLNISDTICYHITETELLENIGLISDAFSGTFTEPEHEMCDAGISRYYAYKYNSATKTYSSVLIKQTGDLQIDNTSEAAGQIYDWLKTVNTYVKYSY